MRPEQPAAIGCRKSGPGCLETFYKSSSLETVVGRASASATPYELKRHRNAMARFGHGMKAVESIARDLA